ncbi:SDR family NAD(P)-dependent oxidoreductase [Geodermatophilus maliterrae]|uniref:SDR family NAD(P)-dependent oxidoreductase n=1 Tax=Geodermatophilus maliterrae TaxID=3162531 RepID=A0ABV3XEP7_9ACTN
MTTIAIVGAGRGLGAASARRFGRQGFDVALLSRSQERVDALAADLAGALESSVHGPVAAVDQLLPGLRALGRGTVLFVNGGSAARPDPQVAGTSIAFAGESAYAQMLHEVLAVEDVHVGQLIIPGAITPGHPRNDPSVLADTLWAMHTERGAFRRFADDLDA